MNRHHYALWLHGEKIIFLLRQEATSPADMEVFKPAEFRWHIPQINDNEWHHYAISVDFPDVSFNHLINLSKFVVPFVKR